MKSSSLLFLLFLLLGCSTDSAASDGLPPTEKLAASFTADADEGRLVVSGGLIGDGREQEIAGGARLVASVGDTHVPLTLIPNAETFAYAAELPLPTGETTLTVALERPSGVSVSGSSVVVPAPFEIVDTPDFVATDQEITIVLSRAPALGENVQLSLTGCFQPRFFDAKGTGERLTFVLTDLDPIRSPCSADAVVYISRDGVLDERFAREFVYGGEGPPHASRFRARQLRRTKLQVSSL
jgi:hypothetical protein